jgi:hypothetical protein
MYGIMDNRKAKNAGAKPLFEKIVTIIPIRKRRRLNQRARLK